MSNYCTPPTSLCFCCLQANLDAFEAGIIPLIAKSIPEGAVVAELYSGIGLVGLNVASKAREVFCSDSNEYVDGVFDKCADSLPKEDQEKVFYECFDAEEAVLQGQCDEADVLIVDPPRKGLDEGVLQLLLDTHPEKRAPGENVKIRVEQSAVCALFLCACFCLHQRDQSKRMTVTLHLPLALSHRFEARGVHQLRVRRTGERHKVSRACERGAPLTYTHTHTCTAHTLSLLSMPSR
jgi:16S rRNA G966 N2-methylase RsmD